MPLSNGDDRVPEDNRAVAITVVVATRGRRDSVVATVESVLGNDYPAFDVIVLDQSDDASTEDALRPFRHDRRLCYIRSALRGLGQGHNAAIRASDGDLIAITDDDCVVPPSWLGTIADAFEVDERVGVVFGLVRPYDYDSAIGYVPVFGVEDEAPVLLTGLRDDLAAGLGIGACCALKRQVWRDVHGFDEMLGPGAPLGSFEDRDMAIRALIAGHAVYYTPAVGVVHHGLRRNDQLRRLAFRDWFGFGSSYAKYIKCGHWGVTRYMIKRMWLGQAVVHAVTYLQRTGRIGRVTPILSFWLGFAAGLAATVDRHTGHFVRRSHGSPGHGPCRPTYGHWPDRNYGAQR